MKLKTFKELEYHIKKFVNAEKSEQFAERTKRFNEELLRVFEYYSIRPLIDFDKLRENCTRVILDVDDGKANYSVPLILTNIRFHIFKKEMVYTGVLGIEDVCCGILPDEEPPKKEFRSWDVERMRINGFSSYN
ncbi:MAG: hypothetical protein Q7J54_06500 [Candidatus Woesearchaeota archaeon]|nr:hypothetical protein [Candidatus Woesearchaeota archaeon]